jgi:hypothetical protein
VDPDEPYDDYQAFHNVLYRLHLLLNNNYFLLPAHSKPSPFDFASPVAAPYKKATKSAAPTFLDIFRVGKAQSKPTTPPSPLTPDVRVPHGYGFTRGFQAMGPTVMGTVPDFSNCRETIPVTTVSRYFTYTLAGPEY